MATERRRIIYYGRVQGVGFRYTAVRIAGGYDITGYVRNQHDGSVEVVAEGETREIDAFVDDLKQAMGRYIERTSQSKSDPTGQYSTFGVEF